MICRSSEHADDHIINVNVFEIEVIHIAIAIGQSIVDSTYCETLNVPLDDRSEARGRSVFFVSDCQPDLEVWVVT
jgi:hypothetical protein